MIVHAREANTRFSLITQSRVHLDGLGNNFVESIALVGGHLALELRWPP